MGCKPITLEEARLRDAKAKERASSIEAELRQATLRVWELQRDLKEAKQAEQRADVLLRRKLVEDETQRQQTNPTVKPTPRATLPRRSTKWDKERHTFTERVDSRREVARRHDRCREWLGY